MSHSKKFFRLKPSKELGDYLKELREQNTSLGQAEAARQVNLAPELLNYFEKGKRSPPDVILIKLAQLYQVPPDEVLAKAHWPQLILLPLISIINPEELSKELIEALEKGLKEEERMKLTRHIKELLYKRSAV